MNYRHAFHAGSFSDVVKHVLLVELLKALMQKDSPIVYLETHAGAGRYDLQSREAQRSREWERGIGRIFTETVVPEDLASYTSIIHRMNEESGSPPRWYPGSPWIAREFMREGDRMILAELHEDTFRELNEQFGELANVSLARRDGFTLLEQTPPPKPGRLFALIDPPYEREEDWRRVHQSLGRVLGGLSTGVFMIWYPIKNDSPLAPFKFELLGLRPERAVEFEFSPFAEDLPDRLNGCGVVLIGAPWRFEERVGERIFPLLNRLLADGCGRVSVRKLGH